MRKVYQAMDGKIFEIEENCRNHEIAILLDLEALPLFFNQHLERIIYAEDVVNFHFDYIVIKEKRQAENFKAYFGNKEELQDLFKFLENREAYGGVFCFDGHQFRPIKEVIEDIEILLKTFKKDEIFLKKEYSSF